MKKENKKGLLSRIIIFLIIFGFLIYLDARYVGTKGLVIREEAITSEKLPEAFNGFKIVHFSDLHYGTTVFLEELENLVDKINLLNPDIVVFTGDLIDKNYKLTDKLNIKAIIKYKYSDKLLTLITLNNKELIIKYKYSFLIVSNPYLKVSSSKIGESITTYIK